MPGMEGPMRAAPAAAGGSSFTRNSRGSFSVKAGTLHEAPKVVWALKTLFYSSVVFLSGTLMWVNDSLSVVGAQSLFTINLFEGLWGWVLFCIIVLTHIVEIFALAIFDGDDVTMKVVTVAFAGFDVISSYFGFLTSEWFKKQNWFGHSMAVGDFLTWAAAIGLAVFIAFVPDRAMSRFAWLLLNHFGFGSIMKDFS